MTRCIAALRIAATLVFAFGLAVAGLGAQTPSPQKPSATTGDAKKPQIKTAVAVPIVSVEGKANYDAYCAVCHGPAGKGDGPAAPAMKAPVPDLTAIAQRNKGRFDATAIQEIIRGTGKTQTPAHGVEEMPIWGEVFRTEDRGVNALRIGNLVKYLQSIQVK